jgi:hypothetical protein
METHFLQGEAQLQTHQTVEDTNPKLDFIFTIWKTTSRQRNEFLWPTLLLLGLN